MKSVGSFAARAHLSALLDLVEQGETIEITRRGRLVAVLAPLDRLIRPDLSKIAEEMLLERRGRKLGKGLTLRQLIEEGRRARVRSFEGRSGSS